jgi:DNA-binding beta-propeller fold protein YncE
MALYNNTTLYVSAYTTVDVYNVSNLSTPSAEWTGYGSGNFLHLFGVAVNPQNGDVYVDDAGVSVVYQFTSAGATVSASTYGFKLPTCVAADSSGNYYVADLDNSAVEEFTPGNAAVTTWTAAGTYTLLSPSAVALDSSNDLYIADENAARIYELAAGTNNLLNYWTMPGKDEVLQMAVDANGLVYVADMNTLKVEEYLPGIQGGGPVAAWNGSQGAGTAFEAPMGIIILPTSGDILVSDYSANLLEEYKP